MRRCSGLLCRARKFEQKETDQTEFHGVGLKIHNVVDVRTKACSASKGPIACVSGFDGSDALSIAVVHMTDLLLNNRWLAMCSFNIESDA